jgi:cellulose synthase/poly-beta-1,6-N-acetylglucosamine synthase-like glycosyltransferase
VIIKHPNHRPAFEPSLPDDLAPTLRLISVTNRAVAHAALTQHGISVVLPAYNEAENIATTVATVVSTLSEIAPNFEVIIVDDGSADATGTIADDLAAADPRVRVIHNRPNRGYGGALRAGFDAAAKEWTFFMDADGQFDIADIRQLIVPMDAGQAQVALGYRAHRADPPLRKLNAWAWKRMVSILFGLRVRDIDCAFKLMPTALLRRATIESTGAMINTEFLAKFQRMGATLVQVPVQHLPRAKGTATGAKLGVILRAFRELFALAGRLRSWQPDGPVPFNETGEDETRNDTESTRKDAEYDGESRAIPRASREIPRSGLPAQSADEVGLEVARYRAWLDGQANQHDIANAPTIHTGAFGGFDVNGQRIQTFTTLGPRDSAAQTLTRGQALVGLGLVGLWVLGLAFWGATTLIATLGIITTVYLGDLLLTAWLVARTLHHSPETHIPDATVRTLVGANWPRYTILCPLYRETEVVPQFMQAMQALDYPADKLQIMFLTEADDAATRNAILGLGLPHHFQVVTVPDGELRTKPRACNYGLLRATGDYVVIFDAEDIPDPLQLKKAVLTFADHDDTLACVQAKLNFYNPQQNLLTRWFTNEYTLWFDLTLPGLQRLRSALPLGGTSNHFRTDILRQVGAWDPFNVTEDCDLGLRLAQHGLRTVVLDSTTLEEANSRPMNWVRQRSRWIKGYLQTYLVHMRRPARYLRPGGLRDFFALQLVVGARSATLYINPLMWLLLLIYVALRGTVEGAYHVLYPAPVFYMGMICLIFGNFLYIYAYLVACAKRRQFGMMRWALLIPIYWAMMSIAATVALWQLIVRPFFWEKTQHGLHLKDAHTAVSVLDLGLSASFTVENSSHMEE